MALAVDKTTLRAYPVHTPDAPGDGIVLITDRATAAAVQAIPQQYRKIVDGSVVEMTQPEKDAVDAAASLAAARSAKRSALAQLVESRQSEGVTITVGETDYTFNSEADDEQELADALLAATALSVAQVTSTGVPLYPRGASTPVPGSADDGLLTGTEFLAFGLPLMAEFSARRQQRISINRQIENATTAAEAEAIEIPEVRA